MTAVTNSNVCWRQQFLLLKLLKRDRRWIIISIPTNPHFISPLCLLFLTAPHFLPLTASFQTTWPNSPMRIIPLQVNNKDSSPYITTFPMLLLVMGSSPCAEASDVLLLIDWKCCKNINFFFMWLGMTIYWHHYWHFACVCACVCVWRHASGYSSQCCPQTVTSWAADNFFWAKLSCSAHFTPPSRPPRSLTPLHLRLLLLPLLITFTTIYLLAGGSHQCWAMLH